MGSSMPKNIVKAGGGSLFSQAFYNLGFYSCTEHRALGLADLEVTAFLKNASKEKTNKTRKKVVKLSDFEEDENKNKRSFPFDLEAGIWVIEVKATKRSFAAYRGNVIIQF